MQLPEDLGDGQRLTYATVRKFAQDELRPLVLLHARDESLVRTVLPRLAELGILGGVFPAEVGGSEIDYVSYCLVCETIAGVSPSVFTGALTVQLSLVASALNKFGSEKQRGTVLKAMLAGAQLGSFALTEPNSGSDPAAGETIATKTADGWQLSGTKLWISNGSICDWSLVFAQTKPGARHKGLTAFLVDMRLPGVQRRPIPNKLGLWQSDTAEIHLDAVAVPDDAVVGAVGQGFAVAQSSLESGRLSTAAAAVGISQACLDASIAYASQRRQWAKPIGAHQLVQEMVTDIAVTTAASRLLVHDAARALDAGLSARSKVAMAKRFATDGAVQCARTAISLHGAVGYVDETGLAGLLRDAIGLSLYEGTNQIQALIVGRELLGMSAFA